MRGRMSTIILNPPARPFNVSPLPLRGIPPSGGLCENGCFSGQLLRVSTFKNLTRVSASGLTSGFARLSPPMQSHNAVCCGGSCRSNRPPPDDRQLRAETICTEKLAWMGKRAESFRPKRGSGGVSPRVPIKGGWAGIQIIGQSLSEAETAGAADAETTKNPGDSRCLIR